MTAQIPYVDKGAQISNDGRYRFRLWREWRLGAQTPPRKAEWKWMKDSQGKYCLDGSGVRLGWPLAAVFVMLNPSTADGDLDDPTIRRCVGFAQAWGYDRLEVINLFAYRATSPENLLALTHKDDPVGAANQRHVDRALDDAGIVVCAWGAHGGFLGQDKTMLGWLDKCGVRGVNVLGLTKEGFPAHPLYLPANRKPSVWRP